MATRRKSGPGDRRNREDELLATVFTDMSPASIGGEVPRPVTTAVEAEAS